MKFHSLGIILATSLLLPVSGHARNLPSIPDVDPDCVILFCMAGGFPTAYKECADALAEMIRRITPWPIEPPLQTCTNPKWSVVKKRLPPVEPNVEAMVKELYEQQQSTINYNDPDYEYLRHITVYHVRFNQKRAGRDDDECRQGDQTEVQYYFGGPDGNQPNGWRRYATNSVPQDILPEVRKYGWCPEYGYRGVAIEWLSYDGERDFKYVSY